MFPSFPDSARLWIFVADRPLDEETRTRFLRAFSAFLPTWQSHGRPVRGAADFLEDRLLLVAGYVEDGDISGCGTDAMMRVVEHLGQTLERRWLSGLTMVYREPAGRIQAVSRGAFRRLLREGSITAETPVFNPALTSVGDLRAGRLEQPLKDSPFARIFPVSTTA